MEWGLLAGSRVSVWLHLLCVFRIKITKMHLARERGQPPLHNDIEKGRGRERVRREREWGELPLLISCVILLLLLVCFIPSFYDTKLHLNFNVVSSEESLCLIINRSAFRY